MNADGTSEDRTYLGELANSEIGEDSHLRMLIVTLVASNWVTLQMILLYVTDLIPVRNAVKMSVFATFALFTGYFLLSRLPIIARNIQKLRGKSNAN